MVGRKDNTGQVLVASLIVGVALLTSCSNYRVIPERLAPFVNKTVRFENLKAAPDRYKGELVVLGGEVLNATRFEDYTRLEVLSLPLSDEWVPMMQRTESQGRFYAFDGGKEILDPEVLNAGTLITVVGEFLGTTTGKLDEAPYDYPMVRIKDLTKWDQTQGRRWPYHYPYYGGAYWHGFRPFPFPYYY